MKRDCKIVIVGSIPSKSFSRLEAPVAGLIRAGSDMDSENLYSSWAYVKNIMHYILADDRT
jgi:hypothetical protein